MEQKTWDVTKLDQRFMDACLALRDSVEREDEYLRLLQMREFKKNNLFWHGFQYLFWSDTDQDWRIPTHEEFEEISDREETRWIYDYVINHFKAHGESIIAALSADIPNVRFGPRNSQDPEDRRAVIAADSTADLIEKWNRAKLQMIEALFLLSCEGFVASYTYNRKDEEYGTIGIKEYDTREEQTTPDTFECPGCGHSLESGALDGTGLGAPNVQSDGGNQEGSGVDSERPSEDSTSDEEPGDGQPDEDTTQENQSFKGQRQPGVKNEQPDVTSGLQPQQAQTPTQPCPQCGQDMQFMPGQMEMVPYIVDERMVPKGREIIEVYGPLEVRVPSYVKKQADAGYLIHYVDADPALFQGTFTNVADKIEPDPGQDYDRLMRQSSLCQDGYQLNIKLATQKRCWFRPWIFNRLKPEYDDILPQLIDEFKKGLYVSFIGDTICEVRCESMDKYWTLTKAGPSKGIHADPILKPEIPLQELRNNLTNLFVMQVEYGVPATYADLEVFDFEGQSKQQVAPGYIYPITPRPGQNIADAFYTERTSTLNKESTQLLNQITSDEQFVVGSYPSIFGGPQTSGSKTLGEYDKSRSFALQRLGLVYYFVDVWWAETIHKAVQSFIEHQIEDEPNTSKTAGGFQTSWIKQADFKGSFMRLEPDPSSDFPVSFAQKRQTLMALAQLNNPQINEVLFAPENAGFVQQYVGLTELKIPMELQKQKQTMEILELIGMEPYDSPQSPGGMKSTVPVEPDIDDHEIHIRILTDFLIGEGQDLKKQNIGAYANCMAHLLEHKQIMQQQIMAMQAQTPPQRGGPQPPKKPPKPVGPPPPEAAQGATQ